MTDTQILAPVLHEAAWPGAAVRAMSRLYDRLAALRVARRERNRFRWELARMAKDNPHLVVDIGLTARQVEAEIARLPFWQR